MVRTKSASRALWRWPTTISASSLRDERSQVGEGDTNGIQDPNMRKLPTRAQAVDGRGAHSKPARDRGHGEQGALVGWALSGAPWRIGNPGLPNCQVRSVGLTMQDEELLVFGNLRAGP